jgi:predicted XRE-type DNA-binding protein
MKEIMEVKKKKATGTLGDMIAEINPNDLLEIRNRMLIAAFLADTMQTMHLDKKQLANLMEISESKISDLLSGN